MGSCQCLAASVTCIIYLCWAQHGVLTAGPQQQRSRQQLHATAGRQPVCSKWQALQAELLWRWSYSQKYNLDKPIGAWPTATVSVSSGPLGKRVTDTFLATSHEYLRVGDYGDERIVSAWANIFKMLSPSPVVRVGGASQDKMTRVPGDNVWIALKKFRDATNCRFILGLPLFPKNSIDTFILGLPLFPKNSIGMSQKIMAQSRKYLGDSVIGYELGNEPEFWPNGLGGWGSDGKWKAGFEAYAQWFHKVALAINPCGSKKMLSGPGWGNVNTQPVSWLARILYQGKECYLRELNVHFYPYINNETVTATQLLSQPLQDFGVSKYKDYQRIGTKERLGIRISETNSLYGGGRPSLSDTLVGALWVADALFAFSDAGAVGFHLHWGIGGHPTEALGQPNTGVQTNYAYNVRPKEPPLPYPSVHAPWYGYLFWTIAAAGDYGRHADANFVPVWVQNRGRCSANMKIWALKADMGDLRMALLNKDEARNCNVRLIVDPQYCKKAGILTRLLPGPEGIFSKGMITWQGQTYEGSGLTGKIQGSKAVQQLMPVKTKDGKRCKFEVPVPSASGAILAAKWSR
ncbi:hypothetical protein OEZ85_004640 [Tetradesmus obliquus]|uniref:Beta-glucuronidase C-terminal domain-containing protein n=1 Tax=Tetradesmus obliquus TaxID=3088 RepID=A0ABY8UPM0_TETOB|nr:hypothetical protein OEZ85_004640 [Tetradesmus obliquus]